MSAPLIIPFNYDPVATLYRSEVNGSGTNSYTIPTGYYAQVSAYTAGAALKFDGSVMQGFEGDVCDQVFGDFGTSVVVYTCPTGRIAEINLNKLTNLQYRWASGPNFDDNLPAAFALYSDRMLLYGGDSIITNSSGGVTDLGLNVRFVDHLTDPVFGTHWASAGTVVTIDSGSTSGYGYFHVKTYSEVT